MSRSDGQSPSRIGTKHRSCPLPTRRSRAGMTGRRRGRKESQSWPAIARGLQQAQPRLSSIACSPANPNRQGQDRHGADDWVKVVDEHGEEVMECPAIRQFLYSQSKSLASCPAASTARYRGRLVLGRTRVLNCVAPLAPPVAWDETAIGLHHGRRRHGQPAATRPSRLSMDIVVLRQAVSRGQFQARALSL